MTYFFYVILNGVKDPTEELPGIYFSLKSWDISLALNMTYFFYVILNGVKDPTEELPGIYFITLVVGYFACAQYDGTFFTSS